MSSAINGRHDSWRVSNMMFWRVIRFAGAAGQGMAAAPAEAEWVTRLSRLEAVWPADSPDIAATDLFTCSAEALFWERVLRHLADLLYQRRVGNQDDQTWQVPTIWAVWDLANLLSVEARVAEWPADWVDIF